RQESSSKKQTRSAPSFEEVGRRGRRPSITPERRPMSTPPCIGGTFFSASAERNLPVGCSWFHTKRAPGLWPEGQNRWHVDETREQAPAAVLAARQAPGSIPENRGRRTALSGSKVSLRLGVTLRDVLRDAP